MAGTLTLHPGDREGPFDELIGHAVGSYRIVRLLGRGGMGAVYLARHPGIGSLVAIKFLHARFSHDRGVVERFFNEARAVNLIGHENILKILDFSSTPDGRYFFVMEYLAGKPLAALALAGKPVPLAVAGPIFLQCCKALQAAHERNIVHRDLKPDNIFLISQMGKKHFVKLVDFGIAKLIDAKGEAQGLTEAGALIGTPEYMSPEQAAGRTGEIGRRSDVYSLGVVMYQLATGRLPFAGPTTAETLVAQMSTPPPLPRSIEPGIPEQYEKILLRALAKKKEDRFASMTELHDALLACLRELGIPAELPVADEPDPPAPGESSDDATKETKLERPAGSETRSAHTPPLTQTFAGDRAPLEARLGRLGDRLLSPSRRGLTLGVVAALIIAVVAASRPRATPPAPSEPPQKTIAQQAHPQAHPQAPAAPPHVEHVAPPPSPTPPATAPALAVKHAVKAPHAQKPKPPPLPAPAQTAAAAKPGVTIATNEAVPVKAAPPPTKPLASSSGPAPTKPGPTKAAGPNVVAAPAPPAKAPAPHPTAASTAAPSSAAAAIGAKPDPFVGALAEMQAAAAKAAQADAAQPKSPGAVNLYVVSNPLGANVTAAWNGRSAAGQTPFVFKVRRGATVSVSFSKPGYTPAVQEVAAQAAQAISVALKKDPPTP